MAGIVSDRAVLYPLRAEAGKAWYLLLRRTPGADGQVTWGPVVAHLDAGEGSAHAAIRALMDATSLQPVRLWSLDQVETEYDARVDCVRLVACFAALVTGVPSVGPPFDGSRWFSATEATNLLRTGPQRGSLEAMHREIGTPLAGGGEPDARLRLV